MATTAQLTSNQQNAQLSTGPVTPEGKSISSKNRLTNGLFSQGDFIRPEEQTEYETLRATLQSELAVVGTLEQTYSTEILSATWRLRRCSLVECDPTSTEDDYRSVDRVRVNAHNILRRATAELRRHQTERQIRNLIYPDGTDLSCLGLTCSKDMTAVYTAYQRSRMVTRRAELEQIASLPPQTAPSPTELGSFRKTAADPISTPPQTIPIARNALCPCHSGEKYKRCCGRNAPPVLHKAA